MSNLYAVNQNNEATLVGIPSLSKEELQASLNSVQGQILAIAPFEEVAIVLARFARTGAAPLVQKKYPNQDGVTVTVAE